MNERSEGRRRRSQRGPTQRERTQSRQSETAAAPAYIKRELPFYEMLSEEGLCILEDQADWLMQEVGSEFRQDPEALDIWRGAGADVSETRVRLPRGLARELCATCPAEFVQHARNPERNVHIGGSNHVFAPGHCPPFVRDLE